MHMWVLRYSRSFVEELRRVPAHERSRIRDAIVKQLTTAPATMTKHKKQIIDLTAPFEAEPPIWQLSVGEWRIFYDVDGTTNQVFVRALRQKPPHLTTKDIL